MTKLTKRQNEILTLIQTHMTATGSPPTRAEIAKTMGFKSPNAAEDHLRALARKGVIELVPGTSRGIRLTRQGIPIILQKVSKHPLLNEDNIQGYARLEQNFFQPEINFLLRITTNAYQAMNILSGDYLAVQQTESAATSELVIIRQNQELVLKSFSQELQAHNITIEGRVVGVIRSLISPTLS